MNIENHIPDVWFDFYVRLIPGFFILGELVVFEIISPDYEFLKVSVLASSMIVLVSAYLVGHFLQPLASRFMQLMEMMVRVYCCMRDLLVVDFLQKVMNLYLPDQVLDKTGFDKLLASHHFFLKSMQATSKAHAEAVGFLSIAMASYFIYHYLVRLESPYSQASGYVVLLSLVLGFERTYNKLKKGKIASSAYIKNPKACAESLKLQYSINWNRKK